jgi:hypothetical protein
MQRLIVDCAGSSAGGSPPTTRVVELTGDELAEHQAMQAVEAAREQAAADRRADLETRRATIVAELQAIRDATGWAAAKQPLLRLLVFLMRRLGERDS